MSNLTVLAPCKLNLFLYITGKRADGYHNLQTLFTLLDFGDEMSFTLTDRPGELNLKGAFNFPPEHNTIIKGLKLLQARADELHLPIKHGITIEVAKRIPQGGGLGGGSSDAAAALLCANHLWQLNLPLNELAAIGLKVGADVPIFIYGRPAFATGVGEKLTAIDLPERWYIVAAPEHCQVNTAKAFADPLLKRDSKERSLEELMKLPFENDFTLSVAKSHPEIGQLLALLVKYAPAHLSGSGACCFVAFDDETTAQSALQEIAAQHRGPLFLARSLNRSPVHATLLTL
ncbi:MAG: 4-(cytidine 5'-diphospho)-2-C-methyl-D-erythritol kinase [Candidatus Anaerobiospirillum merdipullorum]|uniref:4-diphosphocytidyl-2-C-methyl-D-erythritol kinase n=1 Tax=Candidatus Anaerobiospirillum merdipullorum TaxID=2838450 RepID=A0A9E2KN43_9GAMM|nr:4-(cytidine 5'-diphospho)-2-C-methyl-D-erythritol kinase [Candidatus Anaerobiospirillum merdipullorum]